jgi:hypothetical protein
MGKIVGKYRFTKEYELRASSKMLYPYIQTASGLSEWFADEVTIQKPNIFLFIWDKEEHLGEIVSQRINRSVKFEFAPENEHDKKDPSYMELRLDTNEITGSTFLKVTDYSPMENLEELNRLWDGLVTNLREIVGG